MRQKSLSKSLLWLLPFSLLILACGCTHTGNAPMTLRLHGVTFNFARIPPGQFLMGSDSHEDTKPVHLVRIDSAFDLSTTEITVAQYRAFTEATGFVTDYEKHPTWNNWRNTGFAQADNHPAVYLSRDDAEAFCQWLSNETGVLYRLPSEAEWEYAARAGTSEDCPADLDSVAWYRANSEDHTHPVASKQPNAFGLYDMLGSAWEWSEDPWHKDYNGAPGDGRPWPGGDARANKNFPWDAGDGFSLRGGGWHLGPELATFVSRSAWPRNSACSNSGFRLLRTVPVVVPTKQRQYTADHNQAGWSAVPFDRSSFSGLIYPLSESDNSRSDRGAEI